MEETPNPTATLGRAILCPRCKRPMVLADFEMTDPLKPDWTVVDGIACPYSDCRYTFTIENGFAFPLSRTNH
jgi:hypothetical protein